MSSWNMHIKDTKGAHLVVRFQQQGTVKFPIICLVHRTNLQLNWNTGSFWNKYLIFSPNILLKSLLMVCWKADRVMVRVSEREKQFRNSYNCGLRVWIMFDTGVQTCNTESVNFIHLICTLSEIKRYKCVFFPVPAVVPSSLHVLYL